MKYLFEKNAIINQNEESLLQTSSILSSVTSMRIVNFWTAASPLSRAMTQVSTCCARGHESQSIILDRQKVRRGVHNVYITNNFKWHTGKAIHFGGLGVQGYLQSALVMFASLTFWSVVRLLISTVIIWTGICWTRLARAMEGSKEGSAKNESE